MANIFISYTHADREAAEHVRTLLEARGWNTWMDDAIQGGQIFRQAINDRLDAAHGIVVLWSRASVRSHWVIDEAEAGMRRGVLLPVIIDGLAAEAIPLGFQQLHSIRLDLAGEAEPDPGELIGALDRLADVEAHSSLRETVERDRKALLQAHLRGRFELGHELGRGNMAIVYRAQDQLLDRPVAIKVTSLEALFLKRGMYESFRRQAQTAARLKHANIIDVKGYEEWDRLACFIMQFVDGRALNMHIDGSGSIDVPGTISIARQVAQGLSFAHEQGVVHRNLSPAKLILDNSGHVYITDFGIAKLDWKTDRGLMASLPMPPVYMSPEQYRGAEASSASDQYALGVIAYECLTGVPPFAGDSVLALAEGHCYEVPPPIEDQCPECPEALAGIVMRMLAKSPEDRYGSLDEVSTALSQLDLQASALPPDGAIARAHASFDRCDRNALVDALYASLFDACPELRTLFDDDTLARQQHRILHAIRLLLLHAQQQHPGTSVLARVAERHSSRDLAIDPSYYPYFVDSLVTAVSGNDPAFRHETADAWREAVGPGIEYMASRF